MAHPIEPDFVEKKPFSVSKLFSWKLPPLVGKFGLSLMLGKKELFFGLAVAEVEIEKIVKKKKSTAIAPQKARVTTWSFD